MLDANPLAAPLVGVLRDLREARSEARVFRELFLLTVGLLGDSERQLVRSRRTIVKLRDQPRAHQEVAA